MWLDISLYFGLNLAEACSSSSLGLADSECWSSSVITVTNSLTALPKSPGDGSQNTFRKSTVHKEDNLSSSSDDKTNMKNYYYLRTLSYLTYSTPPSNSVAEKLDTMQKVIFLRLLHTKTVMLERKCDVHVQSFYVHLILTCHIIREFQAEWSVKSHQLHKQYIRYI